tara:strand:- start:153 stop:521 length:369 start_codon:yes stop_codon:yes gene_type:complete
MAIQETKNKSIRKVTELLIDRNKIEILFQLILGNKGFNQLKSEIEGINQQILSKQLKKLVKDGFIEKVATKEFPKKSIYSITKFGKTIRPIMNSLTKWQTMNSKEINKIKKRNNRDSLYNYY